MRAFDLSHGLLKQTNFFERAANSSYLFLTTDLQSYTDDVLSLLANLDHVMTEVKIQLRKYCTTTSKNCKAL